MSIIRVFFCVERSLFFTDKSYGNTVASQRQACGNSLSNDLAKITQVFGKKTRKEHVPGHKCGIEPSSLSVLQI